MSNRLQEVLHEDTQPALSIYYTAGFPEKDSTVAVGKALANAGADFLEIGIPFSDPVADGPVIQGSNTQALHNGMTLPLILEQIAELRNEVSIPLILMGYLNPVVQYGMDRFLQEIGSIGVDGVILPDLPTDDFVQKYQQQFVEQGVNTIFLITPQTSEERVRYLDSLSSGFLYAVSSPSITGGAVSLSEERDAYLERLTSYQLKNPLIVGFGIADNAAFRAVSQYTAGAIVGSAFIKHLEKEGVSEEGIRNFVQQIKGNRS